MGARKAIRESEEGGENLAQTFEERSVPWSSVSTRRSRGMCKGKQIPLQIRLLLSEEKKNKLKNKV